MTYEERDIQRKLGVLHIILIWVFLHTASWCHRIEILQLNPVENSAS